MARVLLSAILFLISITASASDTLTLRRVYNFEVGDTFDYKVSTEWVWSGNTMRNDYYYVRHIIESKTLSPDSNTVFYAIRRVGYQVNEIDSTTITNLDSPLYTNYNSPCQAYLTTYSSPSFYNRTINNIQYGGLGCGADTIFGEGLGVTRGVFGGGDGMGSYDNTTAELIYYSKGGEIYGQPYENFTGEELLSYTPIPEDCAEWISEIHDYHPHPSPNADYVLKVSEKVRTGNKVSLAGNVWVELIYTGYQHYTHDNHIDSLIGYFRNDTLNRKVLFKNTLAGAESVLYDFTLINGSALGKSHVILNRKPLNGDSITYWLHNEGSYMQGIGGIYGFMKVMYVNSYTPNGLQPKYGTLKCFSVCGQTIYPSNTTVCPLVSSVKHIANESLTFALSPNPTSASFQVTITSELLTSTLTLTDLTGRELMSLKLESLNSTLSIIELPSGIYLASVTTADGRKTTQKLVKH